MSTEIDVGGAGEERMTATATTDKVGPASEHALVYLSHLGLERIDPPVTCRRRERYGRSEGRTSKGRCKRRWPAILEVNLLKLVDSSQMSLPLLSSYSQCIRHDRNP